MSQASTWQRRRDSRLATWGVRRWLVLLLVLAFSTSSLVHVPMGAHAASAALASLEIASLGHEATGEQRCAGDADEAHGATCCIANVCSYYVPLILSVAITRVTVAEVVAALPDEVHLGRAPSPGFRPPSLFANV